jgi:hypothetical protein
MKRFTMSILVALVATTAGAQTFKARQKKLPRPSPPPVVRKDNTDGVLPRAARGGNPLQMLNPRAPAKYGTAQQSVAVDPDTGKWRGIKLFTINF